MTWQLLCYVLTSQRRCSWCQAAWPPRERIDGPPPVHRWAAAPPEGSKRLCTIWGRGRRERKCGTAASRKTPAVCHDPLPLPWRWSLNDRWRESAKGRKPIRDCGEVRMRLFPCQWWLVWKKAKREVALTTKAQIKPKIWFEGNRQFSNKINAGKKAIALTLTPEYKAAIASLPGHLLKSHECCVHPQALATLPYPICVTRTDTRHEWNWK